MNNNHLIHVFGEVLFDHFPDGSRVLGGEPHYEIVADCAYDFIDGELLEAKSTRGVLYHGSLAISNPIARAALQIVKARHQGKIFVDINLRPPWWDQESLLPLLQDAYWVKLNEAELAALLNDLRRVAEEFRKRDILLVLDIVLNHTSDEHEWAQKAVMGDRRYQDYYYIFDNRKIPDMFEQTMPEIFPESDPDNFTWNGAYAD